MAAVVTLTPEQIAAKLRDLRQALKEWQIFEARYGSLEHLQHEIDTYEWLAGGSP